jgi:hypothetical protein
MPGIPHSEKSNRKNRSARCRRISTMAKRTVAATPTPIAMGTTEIDASGQRQSRMPNGWLAFRAHQP